MKVLILTTVRAPYRVELFNELGKKLDLTVCFEQEHDVVRNKQWYSNEVDHFIEKKLKKSKESLGKIKYDFISIIKNDQWDLCIFYEYSTKTSMLGMLYCILHGIKYAINCDGAIETKSKLKNSVKNFFIKNADACFANGASAQKYFENHHAKAENIYQHPFASLYENDVLKLPLNDLEKQKIREELCLSIDQTIVISVGMFEEKKGFQYLINDFAKLKDKPIVLLLIGGGNLIDKYKEIIKEQGLKNIIIKEFIKKPLLFEYFKAADIFAFPTLYDVWGLVVVEAMSYGLPILSTSFANSAKELIQNGVNGYLCELNNGDFSSKILFLHQHKEVREQFAVQNLKIASHYTIENNALAHLNNIYKVINK